MRFGSVCSGIEAASVAWNPLGWEAAFFSEIEPFPSAVLAHYYPTVPNYGDMNAFRDWPDASIDLLVCGTPCQSFSVAGLRGGMADPRGNLALVYLALAGRYRPRWIVWENVPGVLSSSGGRDFGAFLGGLGELGYGWAYRVLDAQFFGVPQRRRRVFVVGYLGDWRRAAAVLFEPASLRRDSPPSREAREGTANAVTERPDQGGGNDDGTGRGTPLVALDTTQVTSKANHSQPKPGDPCHTLAAGAHAPAVAFGWQNSSSQGDSASEIVTPTLDKSKTPAVLSSGVRRLTPRECERLQGFPDDYTLTPYRGKPAADWPRYKALGNSKAVPTVRWIGKRIAKEDAR